MMGSEVGFEIVLDQSGGFAVGRSAMATVKAGVTA